MVAGDTISGSIGSVFWLFLATLLTVSDYGQIQFLISIAALAAGFSMIANSNTITVFEVKKKDLTGILFLISLGIGGIVSLVLVIIYSRIDIIFLTFGIIVGEMVIGYFLGKKLFYKYATFLILQKILMISLALGLYFFMGLDGIIYGISLSYIPLVIIVLKNIKESEFDFKLLKKNSGFIINNYGTRLVVYSKRNLDKIIIAPILGFQVLGEFALGFQVYLVMMLFSSISFKFLLLKDSEGYNSKKFKMFVFTISVLISILGVFIAPIVIPTLFPNFIDSVEIIQILSLAVIPNTIVLFYSSSFLGNENSRVVLTGVIMSTVVYLSLIVFLSQTLGLQGIGISFVLSSIIYAIFLSIIHKKTKNLKI